MNSPHHPHHEHHDVHQQRLLWFFSFCNQRSSSSSSSSSSGNNNNGSARRGSPRRKSASSRNKFASQYQQQLLQQQKQTSNVFGCDLTEHTHSFSDGDAIPHIVKSCTRFIEKHGIIFGIYRLSGMRNNIHKLRQDFDKNPKTSMIDIEAISSDAHAVACVLKQYFRELPIPLLTFHMYEKFIQLFKHNNTSSSSTTTTNKTNNANNNNDNNNNDDDDEDDVSSYDCASDEANNINTSKDQDKDDNSNSFKHDKITPTCDNAIDTPTTATATTTMKTTSTSVTTKAKSSAKQKSTAAIATTKHVEPTQFTTSASDSQLLSLSSVVTTTTSNIKYQVKLEDLRRLLLQLPKAHYQTLKFLMRHLAFIAANGQKTGMDSKNVAIVWAPNLLKPRELELSAGLETLQIIGLQAVITEQLIKHQKFLFDDQDHIETTTSTTTTAPVGNSDELAQVRKFTGDKDLDNAHRHLQQPEMLHIDQELTTAKETDKQVKDENEENNY